MIKSSDLLLFKALGEETKFRIIELLLEKKKCLREKREYCACEIPSLINRTQSNTSMHLSKLQEWEIIKSRRQGKKIFYSIKDRRIKDILDLLESDKKDISPRNISKNKFLPNKMKK